MMKEQESFFEPNHERLLGIATWAKYLAWPVLLVYVLLTVVKVNEFHYLENNRAMFLNQPSRDLIEILIASPLQAFELGVNMASTLLSGVVYYLILKGIFLGLNMIVETDINYREREDGQNEQ